ncbi:MAG: hypothetical protein P9M14_10730 [Candidatus Alcyoniella australis]|nr:hypothetical protein [Candidatus Alcyoniella australis]
MSAVKHKSAGKAAALSAFLLPGAGQLYNGQRVKGSVVMGVTLIVVVALCLAIARFFLTYLSDIVAVAANQAPDSLIPDVGSLWFWVIILLVIYIYAIVDAYLVGKKAHKTLNARRLD